MQAASQAKLIAAMRPKQPKTRAEQEREDEATVARLAEMYEGRQNEEDDDNEEFDDAA